MRVARLLIITALCSSLSACAGGGFGSNQADFLMALAKDFGANCFMISVPVYGGGVQGARAGGPGTEVNLQAGSCSIKTLPVPAPQLVPGPLSTVPGQPRPSSYRFPLELEASDPEVKRAVYIPTPYGSSEAVLTPVYIPTSSPPAYRPAPPEGR